MYALITCIVYIAGLYTTQRIHMDARKKSNKDDAIAMLTAVSIIVLTMLAMVLITFGRD